MPACATVYTSTMMGASMSAQQLLAHAEGRDCAGPGAFRDRPRRIRVPPGRRAPRRLFHQPYATLTLHPLS